METGGRRKLPPISRLTFSIADCSHNVQYTCTALMCTQLHVIMFVYMWWWWCLCVCVCVCVCVWRGLLYSDYVNIVPRLHTIIILILRMIRKKIQLQEFMMTNVTTQYNIFLTKDSIVGIYDKRRVTTQYNIFLAYVVLQ